jgi:hypothetical protein
LRAAPTNPIISLSSEISGEIIGRYRNDVIGVYAIHPVNTSRPLNVVLSLNSTHLFLNDAGKNKLFVFFKRFVFFMNKFHFVYV